MGIKKVTDAIRGQQWWINCLEVSHLVGVEMLLWHLVNAARDNKLHRRWQCLSILPM